MCKSIPRCEATPTHPGVVLVVGGGQHSHPVPATPLCEAGPGPVYRQIGGNCAIKVGIGVAVVAKETISSSIGDLRRIYKNTIRLFMYKC